MDYCKKCNAEMVLNPKTGKYFCKAKCWLNAQPTKQDDIQRNIEDKNRRIDKSIEIREKSIAFFNSVNSAIEMLKFLGGEKDIKQELVAWREYFYAEWKLWHELQTKADATLLWDNKKQELYNEKSEIDTINADFQVAEEEIKTEDIPF